MTEGYVFNDPELQALEDEYGAGYVITAFNVQDKIRNEGIEGIRYMGRTESHLKRIVPPQTHNRVDRNLAQALRRYGVK